MILDTKDMNKCYGCFACANICPKQCISLKQDDEGFFMPQVDRSLCINCGLCDKICIIGKKTKELVEHEKKPKCYYGYLKNDALRKRSASGGAAYALSEECIRQGGVVFGVVGKWFENVHHVKAETIEELDAICGSKYIQSNIGNVYSETKKELEKGRKVLFTGTPCQIAGLYSYLGRNNRDNLLTLDLICHGVPSQKVLLAEIAELEKKKGKIIWLGRSTKYQFYPSQYIIKYENGEEDIIDEKGMFFRQAFVCGLICRKSCNNCVFASMPRIGDITVGDVFLGFGRKPLEVMDPLNIGVSSIVINSKKGMCAFRDIQHLIKKGRMTLFRTILTHNTLSKGIPESFYRQDYFSLLNKNGFAESKHLIEMNYDEWKKNRIKQSQLFKLQVKKNPKIFFKHLINKFIEFFL